jgi:Protein of unknown function (DUF2846)
MRRAILLAVFAPWLAIPSFGQSTAAPKSSTTQCRPINGSSTPIQPDEQLIGDQLCKSVQTAAAQAEPSAANVPAAAATPAPAPKAEPDTAPPVADQTQATINFYRPRRFQGSALKPSVFVDDAKIGQLHNGDNIKVSIAPGTHRVYSTDKSTGIELTAKPGQTYYVRVDIQTGFWKGHGGVTLVDPQEGKYETTQAAR